MSIVRSPYLLVVIALVVAACEGTGDRMAQTSTTAPPAPIATTPPVDVSSLSWSRVARDDAVLGRDGDQSMRSVTSGGPGFVAVGADDSDGDPDAAVWTSTDGITWSRVPHDEAVFGGDDDQSMSSLVAGGPGLVAVGADGTNLRGLNIDAAVWTSIDGFTWSRVPHEDGIFGGDGDQVINSVVVGGPGLVAVGSETIRFDVDAAVWTSSDGITWSRVPHDEEVFGGRRDQVMLSVVAGGPGLVAVGSAGTGGDHDAAVWISPDGIGWSRVVHDEEVFGGESIQAMHHVTVAGPGLVALGLDGPFDASSAAAWTSSDGIGWSRVPHDEELFGGRGGQAMVGATIGGTGIVAVGWDGPFDARDAAVWGSADGIGWSRFPHDDEALGGLRDQRMLDVVAAEPGLVAVGFEGPGFQGQGGDSDAAVWVLAQEN